MLIKKFNINPLSFNGIFKINVDKEDYDKTHEAISFIKSISSQTTKTYPTYKHGNMYEIIITDDKYDKTLETFLRTQGVNFSHKSMIEIFTEKAIKERLQIPRCHSSSLLPYLVNIKTDKFDEAFKNSTFKQYLGKYPNMRQPERYDGFLEYLKTDEPIEASEVYITENNGKPDITFQDGTHRYAVMRDMGFKNIPVAMSESSLKVAQKFGIV